MSRACFVRPWIDHGLSYVQGIDDIIYPSTFFPSTNNSIPRIKIQQVRSTKSHIYISIYSVTTTLQSLGMTPICLPTSSSQSGLDTGPMPSGPVGMCTSSPSYPIRSTGLRTAAVPVKILVELYFRNSPLGRHLFQRAQQAGPTATQP